MTTNYVKPAEYTTPGTVWDGSTADESWQGFTNVAWGAAAGQVGPGDTLECANDGAQIFDDESCTVGTNGTSGSPITIDLTNATIQNAGSQCISTGARDYITWNGGTLGGYVGTAQTYQVFMYRGSNLIFDGTSFLACTGTVDRAVAMNIDSTEGLVDITYNDCLFEQPIRISYATTAAFTLNGFNVTNSTFTGDGHITTFMGTSGSAQELAVLITNSLYTDNVIIDGNTWTDGSGVALGMKGWQATTASVIKNNTTTDQGTGGTNTELNTFQTGYSKNLVFADNTLIRSYTTGTGDGHCIIIDFAYSSTLYPSDNIVVERNYCNTHPDSEGTGRSGINIWKGTNSTIRANICEGNIFGIKQQNPESTGSVIYNNVFADNSTAAATITLGSLASTWKNNLFLDGVNGIYITGASTAPTETYNCFYGQSGDAINDGSPVAINATSINVDPMIDSDYKPLGQSPLIGAGTSIPYGIHDKSGKRFNHYAPCIGAYEVGVGSAVSRTAR